MRLGVDDTDSPRGGCTTHVLTELVALGRSHGLDVLGEPRLVRLNPNVPWKTRGNAALSVTLGHGAGPSIELGEIEGLPVRGFARGRPPSPSERESFRQAAWSLVQRLADDAARTDPALVVADRPLPASLYESALREVVDPVDVERLLRARGIWYRTAGSTRGVVGAAAAVAWPGRRRTWELIAYRSPGTRGPRDVDRASVLRAARAEPSLFLCHDPRTRRLLVAPHTACPILYGLRSVAREALLRARARVRSEPVDRWLVFRTNQGTGDHVRFRGAVPLGAFRPARVRATVAEPPVVRRGGHVDVALLAEGHRVECRAFEPTKLLPRVVRELLPGDVVEVWGGTGSDPTLRLEGVRVLRLTDDRGPPRAPRCPACQRTTESLGRLRGYRCGGCHRRWPPEAAVRTSRPRRIERGTYHPTPSARRHLAPLGPETRGTPNPA